MTILAAFNLTTGLSEGSTQPNSSTGAARIGTNDFDNNQGDFSPVSLAVNTINSTFETQLDSTQTEFWAAYNHYTLQSSGHTGLMFSVVNAAGDNSWAIWSQANVLGLRSWNGSSWVAIPDHISTRFNLGINGGSLDLSTVAARFDVHMKIHSSTGFIRVYRANKMILSFEGNTVFNGVTEVSRVRFHASSITQTSLAEFIVSTQKTIGQRCYTISVNGAGLSNNWTSGTFASVDEESNFASTVDTDFAQSDTADQILYTALDTLSVPTLPIVGIVVNARALSTAGAPDRMNVGIRAGGTTYHGSDQTLTASYAGKRSVWMTNPFTGVRWVNADIAALEALIRSRT